jgi:serine protease Do
MNRLFSFTLVFLFLVSSGGAQVDSISSSRQTAITRAVESVSAAVVGINVTEIREYRDPWASFFGNDPVFRQFFGNKNYQQEVKSLGSGFIISSDGYVVTNDHVAGNGKSITVTMTNGKKYQANIVGTDPVFDVCLLKLKADSTEKFPFVTFGNSDEVIIGEWVIALGNPFGLFENIDKPIVTVGVVSAKGMNLNVDDNRSYRGLIQTDAVINAGNSGGPLVNANGEVIGINTLIYTAGVSQAYIGYGFAIPVNRIKSIISELKMKGKIERDFWTGLEIRPVDATIARYFSLTQAQGVIVSDIKKNSPAAKAGVQIADIIVEVNDIKINDESSLLQIIQESRAGDTWKMKVFRDKKIISLTMKLEKQTK